MIRGKICQRVKFHRADRYALRDLSDPGLGEKEDLKNVSAKLRERIIELEKKLYEEGEKGKG